MSDIMSNLPFSSFFNDNDDLREMFITQMRNFAETIENADSDISAMIVPYLSMFGLSDLLTRIDNDSAITLLREAAEVAEADEHCTGVLFGYHSDTTMTFINFDFTSGSIATKEVKISAPGNTLGEQLFFSVQVLKHLNDYAEALNISPLVITTKILCGIELDEEESVRYVSSEVN